MCSGYLFMFVASMLQFCEVMKRNRDNRSLPNLKSINLQSVLFQCFFFNGTKREGYHLLPKAERRAYSELPDGDGTNENK